MVLFKELRRKSGNSLVETKAVDLVETLPFPNVSPFQKSENISPLFQN